MAPGFKGTVMNPIAGRNPCRIGEIPGFPVGSRWKGRRELCDEGVHGHLSGGIHGRGQEGAFSIVLSGGYEDDVDLGDQFTYTGQGGQAPREPGVKWSSKQIRDQEWKLGNLALQMSCKRRTPVRVIRGSTLKSPYAPAEGYRYDGLYMVNKAEMKEGKSGFKVCSFLLVRCNGQLSLPDPTREKLPMRKSRPPKWIQKPVHAVDMDSPPVASSSRVQLPTERAFSETDVAALSQKHGKSMSPSRSTLPSRAMKDKERSHPYKDARPLSVPRIVAKKETSVEWDSTESESNWLDKVMKPEPEETKLTIQDLEPTPPTSPELEEGEIDELAEEKETGRHQPPTVPAHQPSKFGCNLPIDTDDDDIYD